MAARNAKRLISKILRKKGDTVVMEDGVAWSRFLGCNFFKELLT